MKPTVKYAKECEEIIQVCQRVYNRNMLAAADGNISLKVDDVILITPSGKPKAFITPDEVAMITIDNEILFGNPSGERLMHLEVYKRCPEAQSVVHAHPPHAIAWTVAHPEMKELPNNCLSEIVLAAGKIPIADYARPGTQDMGDVLGPYLPNYKMMILSRHGALAWGDSLLEAYMGMERLEHSAEILYKAQTLNELSYLPLEEMAALLELRKQIGNRTL
ncbi:MAG: class II aldolase/adducin family protein [Bdellovibrionales bacterium]|nr:class II aldolase/adducin family protein [Bdellovibrionales bacterium]NQZ17937.1 class II aldolase/adducin family protein [Bdellovibrionales bacterium]